MKKTLMLITLGLITLSVSAQKMIEKNLEYTNQSIDIDVKFASDIQLKTWDKATIYIKSETRIEEKKYEDLFELQTNSDGQNITIKDNSESIFKKIWEDYEKENGKKRTYFTRDNEYDIKYTIYIPKKAKFKVSSINGDLSSENIEGEFTADLINGNIKITQYSGVMNLSTINGDIDLKMMNTKVTAETIHGNIYADEKLLFTAENKVIGQKIEGKVAMGVNQLNLHTINGNMYLRI